MCHRYLEKIKSAKYIPPLILACAVSLFSADNVVSFSSPITVNAFLTRGDTLFAASSGGLAAHDLRGGGQSRISSAKIFPDPDLTALCRDGRGNVWAGSRGGYLYRMTTRGQWTTYSNYKAAGWGVTCLYYYGGLIVVGSDKGVSLFDPEKGSVVRNAPTVADFGNPRVNAITSSKDGDTLFVGCDDGVAYLDGLNADPLAQRNFYYPGIWKTRRTRPVVSFISAVSGIFSDTLPAAVFRGQLFRAFGGYIHWGASLDTSAWRDTVMWDTVSRTRARVMHGGKMLTLYNEGDRRLWIGTEDNYYYSFDGQTVSHHRIEGLPLRRASKVALSGSGDVWLLPVMSSSPAWHQGIYRYDGREWHVYNEGNYGGVLGYLGSREVVGVTVGRGGEMWFGTSGGNVKHLDPSRGLVAQLILGNAGFKNVGYYTGNPIHNEWGKSDALALDSSGYLWASVYDHNSGSLFCLNTKGLPDVAPNHAESDPVMAGYRWFFSEAPLKTRNITVLNADADNRIFAYDGQQNRLTVFSHGGNPLRDGIKIDTTFERMGVVSAINCVPDGTTYIAGDGGLRKISRGSRVVEDIDNALTGISSIAVQGNVLWLGSYVSGVLRYDLASGEKRWIGESEGLSSQSVVSVALDEKRGHLWMVTDNSVLRLDVGNSVRVTSGESIRVFPNVFSIGGSAQGARHVTFARLEPRSSVSVYAVNGALVARVNAEYFSGNEWRAAWTPKRNLAPGTYIAVVKPSGKRAKIILKP